MGLKTEKTTILLMGQTAFTGKIRKNIKKISFTLDFLVQICYSSDTKQVATSFNNRRNKLQILLLKNNYWREEL